jgi:thiamine biosynthesis lipoprotein
MGTFAEITCQDKDAINAAFEEISKIEAIASIFDPASEISQLNRTGTLKASGDMIALVKDSLKYHNLSSGAFDITISPIVSIWRQKIKEAQEKKTQVSLPPAHDIYAKLPLIGSEKISIDETTSLIMFMQPGMAIDLGGIAQGYAVDKAVERLKTLGITSALVNLSGDIYCLGKKGNRKWRVAIRHPRNPAEIVCSLDLENQAVATSGDYEQFFMLDGKRYSHIIDPKTGYPVDNRIISVTIVADTTTAADAMSTAIFVLGKERATALVKETDEIVEMKIIEKNDLL